MGLSGPYGELALGSLMFTPDHARGWVEHAAAAFAEQRQLLTVLDQAIGDGDHGDNLARGFAAARDQLLPEGASVGAVLRHVGMTLVSTVGGAAGPLYGTLFLQLGREVGETTDVEDGAFSAGFRAAVTAVAARGRAQAGDKTLLDALCPAAAALESAVRAGMPLPLATHAAAQAADFGAAETVSLIARRGRASYLGERAVGHADPGAVSSTVLIYALRYAVDPSAVDPSAEHPLTVKLSAVEQADGAHVLDPGAARS